MAQVSDVSLANQGFSAFRTELNNILAAMNTSHAGTSAPASLAAGSFWLDTSGGATSHILKFYDGSDHITFATINTTANTVDFSDSSITLADDSVTLAKMASGTDGNIISYDASGNPVAVATGSSGQVLTSAGAGQPPSFQTPSSGGAALTGSTNNTITTVTGANAIQGEAKLTFDGSTLINVQDAGAASEIRASAATVYTKVIADDASGFSAIDYSNDLRFKDAGTEKMRIASTGKVGIGETAPLGNLHVKTADTGASSVSGSADEVVIEGTGNVGMTIQSANDGVGNVYFGDVANGSIGRVSYDHTNNFMSFNTNASESMRIDSAGHVTKPNQPAVLYRGNDEDNLTGDGTSKRLGIDSGAGITEIFDVNSDLSGGTFTAPVTGKYLIAGQIWIDDISTSHTDFLIQMQTSNRTYYVAMDPGELPRSSGNSLGFPFCALADMDANDTHIFTISVSGGSKVIDLVSLTTVGITLLS